MGARAPIRHGVSSRVEPSIEGNPEGLLREAKFPVSVRLRSQSEKVISTESNARFGCTATVSETRLSGGQSVERTWERAS